MDICRVDIVFVVVIYISPLIHPTYLNFNFVQLIQKPA